MATEEGAPAVGARLCVGSQLATIRYIGEVEGQQGVWAGLEWDDASRGKHDGSHGGRRYFSCRSGAAACSFVRLTKLLESADLGQTLAAAIQARYKSFDTDGRDAEEAYVSTSSQRRVAIRLVGAEEAAAAASEDGALQQVSFVGMRISSLEIDPFVAAFLTRASTLDLSENLIGCWTAVASLAAALPSLHTLNLSRNLLDIPNTPTPPFPRLTSLQTLVLNGCGVAWPRAVALASSLPSLRELHLCGSGVSTLSLPPNPEQRAVSLRLASALSSLQLLDLEENLLADWAEVASLAELPNLETLLLGGNALREVFYPASGGFSRLRTIMLGSNKLADLGAVDELDRFPELRDVRLSDNPLPAERYEIVARIGGLQALNGGEVSAAERWDAELAYLRTLIDMVAEATNKDAVVAAHPRFQPLIAKYGALAPSGPSTAQGTSLASTMVEITLYAGGKEAKKKVPGSLTIGRLKALLERVLRVRVAHQGVVLVAPSGDAEDVTQEDGRELRYFGVGNGWRVEVGERAGGTRDSAAEEHEQRMEEHEQGMQRLRNAEEQLMVAPAK